MKCRLCGYEDRRTLPYRYVWRDDEFRLSQCRNCSLIAVDPLPSDDVISSFYDQDYFETGLHGLEEAGHSYEKRMSDSADATLQYVRNHILKYHPSPTSFFEIGAATGHLLDAARRSGVDRLSGIEISEHAASIAKTRFDLTVHVGDVGSFDPGDTAGTWDVVYAGDVLEHVKDPIGLITKMASLLAPGGKAVVRIPTTFDLLSSRLATVALSATGKVMTLPDAPYHLHEFTSRTARRLFESVFSNIDVHPDIVPASRINTKGGRVVYKVKKAIHYLNMPITTITGRWGDRLTIVASR